MWPPGQNQAGPQLQEGFHQTCAKVSQIIWFVRFSKIHVARFHKIYFTMFLKAPNVGSVAMLIAGNWWSKTIMYQLETQQNLPDLASTWFPPFLSARTASMTRCLSNHFQPNVLNQYGLEVEFCQLLTSLSHGDGESRGVEAASVAGQVAGRFHLWLFHGHLSFNFLLYSSEFSLFRLHLSVHYFVFIGVLIHFYWSEFYFFVFIWVLTFCIHLWPELSVPTYSHLVKFAEHHWFRSCGVPWSRHVPGKDVTSSIMTWGHC